MKANTVLHLIVSLFYTLFYTLFGTLIGKIEQYTLWEFVRFFYLTYPYILVNIYFIKSYGKLTNFYNTSNFSNSKLFVFETCK